MLKISVETINPWFVSTKSPNTGKNKTVHKLTLTCNLWKKSMRQKREGVNPIKCQSVHKECPLSSTCTEKKECTFTVSSQGPWCHIPRQHPTGKQCHKFGTSFSL